MGELTPLQEAERRALCKDAQAIIEVVNAVRCYRAAIKKMLDLRYRDGEVDGATLSSFEFATEEIEDMEYES